MSRGLSTANANAVDSQVVRPVTFVEIYFDEGSSTLYLHDNIGPITADDSTGTSRTWEGVGDYGGVSRIEEGQQVAPFKVDLMLSGLDSTIANEVLTDNVVLREVALLVGFIDLDRVVVADPHLTWKGYVDNVQVAVGSSSVIRLSCESQLAAFEKKNGRVVNDASQQAEWSGDQFLEYLPQMIEAKITWGGQTQFFGTGSAYNSGIVGGSGLVPGVDFQVR